MEKQHLCTGFFSLTYKTVDLLCTNYVTVKIKTITVFVQKVDAMFLFIFIAPSHTADDVAAEGRARESSRERGPITDFHH
jgi:hypothetical protein